MKYIKWLIIIKGRDCRKIITAERPRELNDGKEKNEKSEGRVGPAGLQAAGSGKSAAV